ncbi:MAG: flavodoxin family protein [Dehalococcoidia bacterium]|nr:flavodoxin family protein [Dehalococcoidia bacterium]
MKVLGIAGSPRYHSNSGILLQQVLSGAKSSGAEIEAISTRTLKIMPCVHCDVCQNGDGCFEQDDAQDVFKAIEQAEIIVLASPIHFMGLPSHLKALVDRTQQFWHKKYRLQQPPLSSSLSRQGLFIAVGGRNGERLFEGAESTVKAFFACLNIKYRGLLAFPSTDAPDQIQNNQSALTLAFETGQKLVAAI